MVGARLGGSGSPARNVGADNRCRVVQYPAQASPTRRSRARTVAMLNRAGSRRAPSSSQASGVEAQARLPAPSFAGVRLQHGALFFAQLEWLRLEQLPHPRSLIYDQHKHDRLGPAIGTRVELRNAFGVLMNLATDSRRPAPMRGAFRFREGSGVRRAPTRVLLVEDDAAIRESMGEGLRENGLKVDLAENGREALDVLRTRTLPSAIVLDLMMPEMDGWDFRQEQLRNPALRDIPIVVVTATGFSANTIRMQMGNVAVIAKPVRTDDLLDALKRACGAQ